MPAQSHQTSLLEAVFDNLVLPPKLPDAPEDGSILLNWELSSRLIRACRQMESPSSDISWSTLEASLLLTRDLHQPVSIETLMTAFSTIAQDGGANWLALHVAQQNAAIIIYKNKETDEVVFEAFEVSASAPAVLEANHALRWIFPSRAVAIRMDEFASASFQETISEFTEQATEIAFDQFAARARKGGQMIVETRDAPSPALITEMLMSFLEATGRAFPVHAVRKRVRDDVVLGSSEHPWRRSPYWLMLRVFVQRIMMTWCQNDPWASRICYKLIMCVVLSHLLSDCQTSIHPERVLMLQAKLCRRLAKLQKEIADAPAALQKKYGNEFFQHRVFFESTLMEATRVITALWDEHKRKVTRPIPLLPWTTDQSDLVLKLRNSGDKLRTLLTVNIAPPKRPSIQAPPSHAEGTVAQVNEFVTRYSDLATCAKSAMSTLHSPSPTFEDSCLELSRAMTTYMHAVGSRYVDDATLMSQYLLNLFELWVAMDSAAISACPTLTEYHPSFVPEALDMLCFMSKSDMARLRQVQEHIFNRITHCSHARLNIFDDPSHKKIFAESYMRDCGESSGLKSLMERIEAASVASEEDKKRELSLLMSQHEKLSAEIKSGTCVCTRQADGTLDVRGCKRCYKARCRRRLKIKVHEAFLPRKKPLKAAVLLELGMPEFLAAYRDATWRLRMLGWKNATRGCEASVFLAGFRPLKSFQSKIKSRTSLILASQSKSYLQTHYKELRLPKMPAEVLLSFGPTFTYYDAANGIWANDCRETPWYHHLLGPWLPEGISDPFAQPLLYMDNMEHPSSYEVAANQDECPPGMSHHEFTAYQAVISGAYRRWMALTLELGSTNLNLSSCSTSKCLRRLALQSGPPHLAAESDPLGKVHSVFQDIEFCKSLEQHIRLRLGALQSGRRDLDGMSILLACTLRLFYLGPGEVKPNITILLFEMRSLLSLWISQLRQEVRSTRDGQTARKSASSAFWAALLCRETFTAGTFSETYISEEEALNFFRASIALSENLIVKLDVIPQDLQQLLAQNMSWACAISKNIKMMTFGNSPALEKIINETWTHYGDSEARSFSDWTFCDGGDWLTSRTLATKLVSSQTVHYHCIEGHLLIDGKTLGQLPPAIRDAAGILELFQGQHLLTRASGVAGMEYQIINSTENHEVHVGISQGEVIIRARFNNQLLQYVPREIFRNNTTLDLPSGLVDDCVHWLNLHTGDLEMRRKPSIWVPKPSNWILNVQNQTAVRGRIVHGATTVKEGTSLVEPQSHIGRIIANIFRDFEDASNLTIFQPLSSVGRLSVEIKRLEMRFFVNRKGLLQSPQLKSEVDPVQDLGALHGLQSKIVLRNSANPRRQSVMVPIGPCSWERNGLHVSVKILNEGRYALFTIDPLLGRLTCAPEPALFYLKALVHAMTSFPIPDKLTGRTGTEEARMCLTAGQSQPWKPLNVLPKGILSMIMDIGPKREYYPPNLRLYQRVVWDDGLTSTIQHEQLAVHAADILRQSQALDVLNGSANAQDTLQLQLPDLSVLSLRGILRRQVYERITHPSDIELLSRASESHVYHPRGTEFQARESTRVYRSIKQLRARSGEFPKPQSLRRMLKNWRSFDGFNDTFDMLDIARNLSIETPKAFGPLVKLLSSSSDITLDHMAQLSFALFVFGKQRSAKAIKWLAAIGSRIDLQSIAPPKIDMFAHFEPECGLDELAIEMLVISCQESYPSYLSSGGVGRKLRRAVAPSLQMYEGHVQQDAENIASWLGNAWPDIPLSRAQFNEECNRLNLKVVSLKKVWTCLEPELQRLSQNHTLSQYISSLEVASGLLHGDSGSHSYSNTGNDNDNDNNDATATERGCNTVEPAALGVQSHFPGFEIAPFRVPSLTEIARCCRDETESAIWSAYRSGAPAQGGSRQLRLTGTLQRSASISRELSILHEIVQPFKNSESMLQQQYGQDLEDSITAMSSFLEQPKAPYLVLSQDDVDFQIQNAEEEFYYALNDIHRPLMQQSACYFWLEKGHLWPCESPTAILEQLRLENFNSFSSQLQQSLIYIGTFLTKLQHLLRIQDAKLGHDDKKLQEELKSAAHSNWRPASQPEWLLLEIDNNILIRPLQVDVAKAIISPQSSRNSVLQMNMGTGKTSVVIPMAALVLANTSKLCRVIVPKALLLQTAQVLQSRIGGLNGRQVCHIPFSRRSPSNATTLSKYKDIHDRMLQTGGIMLCLPSHILSFKLSGLQRLADHRLKDGRQMVEIQAWLDSTCRDVLDESDMTLSVYTQLIYPSGDLITLDGHAYRWLVVEQLLGFVEGHSSSLQKTFEGQVVVVPRHQGYPIIHFITKDPEDALNELLVEDICKGRLPQFQIREEEVENTKSLIRDIITGAHFSSSEWDQAYKSMKDVTFGPKILYLLRGLISQRILLVCLKKKWNIQYGLHPERQPIAVPFEAKGTPSQAAEYGHPDTTLILTCLAFYQQGLSKEQLKQGLQGVMQSDDAAAHYDRWVCSCTTLPPSLQYWSSLDPENDLQVETLWIYLRFDRTVINHHLNTYIFPRYAKQFPVKLLASGWDIPLLQPAGSGDEHSFTTGFSGTNDNKRILPQTIKQNDLPKLLHTNAEVLCHLLERRNADCYLTAVSGVRFDEHATLRFLCDKQIRVLIDAGAHILEMENQDVARTWLGIDTQAEGAVYFGANSQIMVRSRFQKDPMPLIASPFANDIEKCVVYIDEGHTRGTDLKLPADAKGAVTLSLGQTKDQTVQGKFSHPNGREQGFLFGRLTNTALAAMRLRQLGTTQSVAFLAPPEVFQGILDLRLAHTQEFYRSSNIASRDVVRWLLEQSCKVNEQMMSLYLSQCRDFCRRTDMLWKYPDYATSKNDLEKVLGVIRQEEQQTLHQMYGPRLPSQQTARVTLASRQLQVFAQSVEQMARHVQSSYSSALMEVEQEREIVLEVEHMRENQKRIRHVALAFPGLDTAITAFIETGKLDTQGTGTRPPLLQAFDYVGRTKIGKVFGIQATASRLYVSHEFSQTIDMTHAREKDDIIRPVNWILWSPSSETALIVIPEEADVVVPLLRKIAKPRVWLLGYAAPVTKSMQTFNRLSCLTVPRWPSAREVPVWLGIEVGIFSGRLYFEFAEYKPLLAWLAALPNTGRAGGLASGGSEQLLQFLQEWLTFRRRTEDILYTPVGFVCQRQELHEGHFFFSGMGATTAHTASTAAGVRGREATLDHDEANGVL